MATQDRDSPPMRTARRIRLAGRLIAKDKHRITLELMDGLTVSAAGDDCEVIRQGTDASLRPVALVEIRGDKPVDAIFEPHLYRVLQDSHLVPFAFGALQDESVQPVSVVMARAATGGSGGRSHHETAMLSRTWFGTTQKDGFKGDDASEPDEIVLN